MPTFAQVSKVVRAYNKMARGGGRPFLVSVVKYDGERIREDYLEFEGIVTVDEVLDDLAEHFPMDVDEVVECICKTGFEECCLDKVELAAIRKFGITDDIEEAGYFLRDGRMLDFTGRHHGQDGAYAYNPDTQRYEMTGKIKRDTEAKTRSTDHSEVAGIGLGPGSGAELRRRFMFRHGAVRVNGCIGVQVAVMPTDAQLAAIARAHARVCPFTRHAQWGFAVEVSEPATGRVVDHEDFHRLTAGGMKAFLEEAFEKVGWGRDLSILHPLELALLETTPVAKAIENTAFILKDGTRISFDGYPVHADLVSNKVDHALLEEYDIFSIGGENYALVTGAVRLAHGMSGGVFTFRCEPTSYQVKAMMDAFYNESFYYGPDRHFEAVIWLPDGKFVRYVDNAPSEKRLRFFINKHCKEK
jgi:hypothetical protein